MKPDAKANNPFLAQRKPGEPNVRSREMRIDKIDVEKKTVDLSFSSDVDLERFHGYFEKLDHSPGAIDLTRLNNSASALFNHRWDEVIGVVEKAWVKEGKGYVEMRFGNSHRAQEVWPDVRDGIMKNVSVGYEVLSDELTRSDETGDHWTVTRWAPYEVSIVTVPADISVGVGRAALLSLETTTNTRMSTATPATEPAPAAVAAPAATPAPTPAVVVTETRASQMEDAKRVLAIGQRFHAKEEAAQAVADGISVEEFQAQLLARTKQAVDSRTETPLGLSDREIQRFSFARIIAADVASKMNLPDAARLKEDAAFELDVVTAASKKRTQQNRKVQGLYIPGEILRHGRVKLNDEQREAFAAAQRAVISVASTVGNANVGATFVPELDTASFAELLRPECLLMNHATVVNGLSGPYEIPKHVSGATGGWVSEDGDAPGQNAIFTMLPAVPHTVGGLTEVTRRALLQSALDLESILRSDLARGVGQTADLAGYYGTGQNGQPTGLTLTDGVKTVGFAGNGAGNDGISPEWTELVQMETTVGQGNVKLDPSNGAYLFNVYGRGWAKTRQKFPGTPTGMTIWEPGNTINGYQTGISNQIQNGHWFLGNWKEMFIAMWSGLDLLVDPFTHSAKGRVRIVALQDMDYLIRRPEAFCFGFK